MQRLIDADRAENDIAEHITTKAVSRVLAILQGQPTVKAIAIKWIEQYVRDHFTFEEWYGGFVKGVADMLDDWEKENETKTN